MLFLCRSCQEAVLRLSSRFSHLSVLGVSKSDGLSYKNVCEQRRRAHNQKARDRTDALKWKSIEYGHAYRLGHLRYFSVTPLTQRCSADQHAQRVQRPIAQTTIDEEEVNKFSELSELWWDEAGEFEALHSMNEIRVPLIRDALVSQRHEQGMDADLKPVLPLEGLQILDVGSGGGILSEPLARLGAFVIGVDASEENIKIAQAHVMHYAKVARNIKYIKTTVEDLVLTEAGKFDAVVASEVVEHVADVSTFVSACCQLVKPGGSIFLTTLNKTYLSYALGVLGAENFLHLVSPGTHDWNKFISPQELQYILYQNHFSTRLLHGMMYNPLTKRWSWISNTSVNYAIHAVRALDPPTHTSSTAQQKD